MKYCVECGNKLEIKMLENEGMIPFCNKCNSYRFPIFNAGVSAVVLNKERNKTLFIRQSGKVRNILVAGYINKGENAEEALLRELSEEIGVKPIYYEFQKTHYWEKSNTLLINYYVVLENEIINPNYEVDSYEWYDLDTAYQVVAKGGLAEEFYKYYYHKNIISNL